MINNKTFTLDSTKKGLFSGSYNTIWITDESSENIIFENQKEIEKIYGQPIQLNLLKNEVEKWQTIKNSSSI